MQNPTAPTSPVAPTLARWAAAPAMSLAAWSIARPIIILPASSGSVVCSTVVEVGRERDETRGREPVGERHDVRDEAPPLLDHDDARAAAPVSGSAR